MELKVGSSYILVFNVGGKALSFTCKIISVDDSFVTFEDKFRKILTYNKSNIISCEEIEHG